MSDTIIRRIVATPVSVPAKPDSLNSPEREDESAEYLAKFKMQGNWADFVHLTMFANFPLRCSDSNPTWSISNSLRRRASAKYRRELRRRTFHKA